MNTWKVIFATIVIFGAGVVTGGLLVKSSIPVPHPPRAAGQLRPPQPVSAGGTRGEFLRRVGRDLGLTPEQREQLDRLIIASQERTHKLMEPVQPKLREEVQRTKEEFRALLTPEQRLHFDELMKKQSHPRRVEENLPSERRPREQHRPLSPSQNPLDGVPVTNPGSLTNP